MKLIKHDSFFNDPWIDLDRLFESTFPELYQWSPVRSAGRERSLPLDVYEMEDKRVVRFEVPGIRKKDIQLELENAILSIKAKRQDKTGDQESFVEFTRSVSIGEDVDPDTIVATLEDGMLSVELRKREETQPRSITIS